MDGVSLDKNNVFYDNEENLFLMEEEISKFIQ